ncbi:PAS domain S-box protein [Methylomonas sp. HW2-6]|uniref:PAS domain S-box protein n=1 Tax=Methylomonas TaxID=416 RepID=UPI00112C4F6E|nr:PAS domain-containing protein [Methylomonas koyamae]TPQ24319.1 histidine kinase [Methylomonas koyamae]
MNLKWDGIERRKSLREKAEAMVSSVSPPASMNIQPAEMLLHELLVHKIELEMQNDELQRTHQALTESRDRYKDLYEFAPAGYLIIDAEDQISEINLAGAALFGANRDRLHLARFSRFVAADYRDHWYRQFRQMMDSADAEGLAFDLELLHQDGSVFYAHLDCRRREFTDTQPMLLVFLTQIGKR